ncbi:hypothetical protein AMAG_04756 [Allomyces macrogynus ATCC 38327]|uniref:B30.2/SPRY domain-containing protein n=1 Tax=Allomyces macrogynus (strain ATCC 38327) TaxID=578462 RepID=A0A0L0S6C5_ALLM3|nr:hypothetical protein AMAG_04756 [Allomyces macrogynus ATCC 38327]|eukprot:KNE57914.1 hypothetical protein AMAG_04756 [Allomyces macrogynus ATCC 38327]
MPKAKSDRAADASGKSGTAPKKPFVLSYPDLDNVDAPTTLCRDPTHSSQKVAILNDARSVVGGLGYRQVKANHGVVEGRWYFEVKITKLREKGNARIGWATIAGDLQAPCGFDAFSYAYRAKPGTLFHEARAVKHPAQEAIERGYGEGDVLGVMIYLPSPTPDQDAILRDRRWTGPQKYQPVKFFLPHPNASSSSHIRYFVNGVDITSTTGDADPRPAFAHLHLGKYYPAISLFRDAEVAVNFGPDFAFPPPNLTTTMPTDAPSTPNAAGIDRLLYLSVAHGMHALGHCYPYAMVRDLVPCIQLPSANSQARTKARGPSPTAAAPAAAPDAPTVVMSPPPRPIRHDSITSPTLRVAVDETVERAGMGGVPPVLALPSPGMRGE